MSGLREKAAAPWPDGAANEAPVPDRGRTSRGAELRERIMAGLSTIGDLARVALSVITSLAALMFLVLVVVEWRTVRTLVEPLQVPDTLVDKGLTAEVMSSTLLDRISAVTASDRDRWRPASIAPGWGTTDLNIPLLDISVASLAGLAKTLWGPPDLRVTGEVVPPQVRPAPTRCGLQAQGSDQWLGRASSLRTRASGTRPPTRSRQLFDPVIHELLLHTDPLSLANHELRHRGRAVPGALGRSTEPRRRPVPTAPARRDRRGDRPLHRDCGATDKALAYILWGDLLRRPATCAGRTPRCSRTRSTNMQRRSHSRTRPGSPTPTGVRRWTSWAGRRKARPSIAEAVAEHDDDYLAHYDLAEHLRWGSANPAEAAADPNLRRGDRSLWRARPTAAGQRLDADTLGAGAAAARGPCGGSG